METKEIAHYKKLLKLNLKKNLHKFLGKSASNELVYTMIDRIEYYMQNYTKEFDPEKYTITSIEIGSTKHIRVNLKSGNITRILIFLPNGELFGVKHTDSNKPGSFTYGLSDKSVRKINIMIPTVKEKE